jgi:hypothetical protein
MRTTFFIAVILIIASVADAQTRRRTRTKTTKPAATSTVPAPTPSVSPEEPALKQPEPKRNERPAETRTAAAVLQKIEPTYFYDFSQPEFQISRIAIEHDDRGRGTITFTKKPFAETISDPLQVSSAALERIDAAYAALNFLASRESYQYEKDYSHLGVSTFRLKREGRERTAVFNYTVNKDAKVLADEYRKIGNQFIWVFDITVARENQPLEAPRLLDALDALMRRNEISDPAQLLPLLNDLADDERIPLIARNHARKLAEKIGKKK